MLLASYGTYVILWVFHTYYLLVDSFRRVVLYVASIYAIVLINPALEFAGVRIRSRSGSIVVVALIYMLRPFFTAFDFLFLASLVNIHPSFPGTGEA